MKADFMPDSGNSQIGKVAEWLKGHRSLLLLSHERPDGDAFGSMLGCAAALNLAGWQCQAYSSQPLPERYRQACGAADSVLVHEITADAAFSGILSLDCTGTDRLDAPAGMDLNNCGLDLCLIDHHVDNARFASLNWVDADMGATAQMVSLLLREMGLRIPPEAADALLTGILLDTGCMQFTNTTPAVLREIAFLCEFGGDYKRLIDVLFFQNAFALQLLKAEVLRRSRRIYGGRLIYCVVDEGLLKQCGVSSNETEGVIDILRPIAGVEVSCLIQEQGEDIRFSFRGRSEAIPVAPLARKLKGGGHLLAAGATLKNSSLAEAEAELLKITAELFD